MRAGAVDIGASSGRVLAGEVTADSLDVREVHRFPNEPIRVDGTLCWDLDALWVGMLTGLRRAGDIDSIGIDTWAVDYGLLDADGQLLHPPVHYRDSRTDGLIEQVCKRIGAERIYATTGLQFMQFNTLYQLLTEPADRLDAAATMLMVPDLLLWKLTGAIGAERTNASTTQLYDPRQRAWADDLIAEVGLPRRIFPELREAGETIGALKPGLLEATPTAVAVGSHDTASAVAAVPATNPRFAYISCGTWSLVGVELESPVLTDDSRQANFTNEIGIEDTVRYLRNVMGLWLLQECLRQWGDPDLDELLTAAAAEPALRSVVDAEADDFLAPDDMPGRIAEHCRRGGQPEPASRPAMVRCIIDSLALAHAKTVAQAVRLADHEVEVVHLVGGGSRNRLLCQLTADACRLPVLAGPVEATALGNLLVQVRGIVGDRWALREVVRRTERIERYEPTGDPGAWAAAAARIA